MFLSKEHDRAYLGRTSPGPAGFKQVSSMVSLKHTNFVLNTICFILLCDASPGVSPLLVPELYDVVKGLHSGHF